MIGRFAQRSRSRIIVLISPLLLCTLLLGACGPQAVTKEPSAAALMPNLAGYQVSDTTNIQDAIAKLAGGGAVLAGQPEVAALVTGVNSIVACYQKAGGIEGRSYVNSADVTKAGVVVIVNRNVLTDPATFLNCVLPQTGFRAATIQPCGKAYTLTTDNNQFYIGYAATNPEVCQAFCSALQGCTP
jgi:hypothetical protein